MFDDVNQIRKTRKRYNLHMFRSGVGTFEKMAELEAAALQDGALARKYKELVALGISISHGCYG